MSRRILHKHSLTAPRTALDVDVFTANAGYRGVTFSDLWTGLQTPGFSGFFNLSCATSKPLLIGEMGWHQVNDAQNLQNPTWFNQLYGGAPPVGMCVVCVCVLLSYATHTVTHATHRSDRQHRQGLHRRHLFRVER